MESSTTSSPLTTASDLSLVNQMLGQYATFSEPLVPTVDTSSKTVDADTIKSDTSPVSQSRNIIPLEVIEDTLAKEAHSRRESMTDDHTTNNTLIIINVTPPIVSDTLPKIGGVSVQNVMSSHSNSNSGETHVTAIDHMPNHLRRSNSEKTIQSIDKIAFTLEPFVESNRNKTRADECIQDLHQIKKLLKTDKDLTDVEKYGVLVSIACRDLYENNIDVVTTCVGRLNVEKILGTDYSDVIVDIAETGLTKYFSTKSESGSDDNCVFHYLTDMKMLHRLTLNPKDVTKLIDEITNIKTKAASLTFKTSTCQRQLQTTIDKLETLLSLTLNLND
jgi:hypothetical protein